MGYIDKIYISHRGNIDGANPSLENNPDYIDRALSLGYDVEIDLWCNDGAFYLGHDSIQYEVNLEWLSTRSAKLWIHCKDVEAVCQLITKPEFNIFWHQTDTVTLTSHNYIWAYPGNQPIKQSIAVLPELYDDNITQSQGICSDYIQKYKK